MPCVCRQVFEEQADAYVPWAGKNAEKIFEVFKGVFSILSKQKEEVSLTANLFSNNVPTIQIESVLGVGKGFGEFDYQLRFINRSKKAVLVNLTEGFDPLERLLVELRPGQKRELKHVSKLLPSEVECGFAYLVVAPDKVNNGNLNKFPINLLMPRFGPESINLA